SVTLCGGTRLTRRLRPDAPLTIGQSRSAVLRIPHPTLGEIHCTITLENGLAVLRDGGSPAGTKVNGWPVDSTGVLLNDGDEITVGMFWLLFAWKTPSPPDSSMPTPTRAEENASVPEEAAVLVETRTEPPSVPETDSLTNQSASPGGGVPTVCFRGKTVEAVPLIDGLTLGSGP